MVLLTTSCGVDKKVNRFFNQVKSVPDKLTDIFDIDMSIGNFRLLATDEPFTYDRIKSAHIVFSKLEVKDISGSFHPGPNREMELDLAKLRNGRYTIMADFNLPPGEYVEIKLHVKEASIILSNDKKVDVLVPKSATEGFSVSFPMKLIVSDKGSNDFLIDFNLAKTFLPRGDLTDLDKVTAFDFVPLTRLSNLHTAGAVGGKILSSDKTALVGALIEINHDKWSASALSEGEGYFAIIGLPDGKYEAKVSAPGHIEQKNISVKVEEGKVTPFGTILIKNTL